MPTVYITDKIPDEGLIILQKKDYTITINKTGKNLTKSELKEIISIYNALITLVTDKIDAEVISCASKDLKIISNYGVGYDNIDLLAAKRAGVIVCNTPGVASESVAEHTFALILACSKQLLTADRYVRLGKYQRWELLSFLSPQIWGKTIGIIGLGRIGTFVAQIAHGGFRMNVFYFDKVKYEDFEILTEAKFCSLETLLRESDFVTIHVPLNEKTRHLIGKEELKIMKKTAILVNTARGAIIDEEALIWALQEKEIAAAGLDVYENEPNVPRDLLTLDNVVLTPHSASATTETRVAMSKIAAENIIAVFEGKEPFGLVKV